VATARADRACLTAIVDLRILQFANETTSAVGTSADANFAIPGG